MFEIATTLNYSDIKSKGFEEDRGSNIEVMLDSICFESFEVMRKYICASVCSLSKTVAIFINDRHCRQIFSVLDKTNLFWI
jgi:hypothetical protein